VRRWTADLHIHTAVSPCASEEMTPPAIVAAAKREGLAMVAICDHNTAANIEATQQAGGDTLSVVAGMEITTAEEVHVVGLFAHADAARAAAERVQASLPDPRHGHTPSDDQPVMDAWGRVVGRETKLLAGASALTLNDAVRLIHAHEGLAIAAHVDRPSFSVTGQLGFLPPDAGFDAVELSAAGVAAGRFPRVAALGLPVVACSDSHFLEEVGGVCTHLEMQAPSFEELAQALRGENGRRCLDA